VKRLVSKQRVSTVICGYKLSDETAEELFQDLPGFCSMLVVAIQSMLEMVESDEIFRLAAPVSRSDLLSAVQTLLQVGRRVEQLALVEGAKGVLMDRHGITEEQAHRLLQRKSMDSGEKLVQTARRIIDGTWSI